MPGPIIGYDPNGVPIYGPDPLAAAASGGSSSTAPTAFNPAGGGANPYATPTATPGSAPLNVQGTQTATGQTPTGQTPIVQAQGGGTNIFGSMLSGATGGTTQSGPGGQYSGNANGVIGQGENTLASLPGGSIFQGLGLAPQNQSWNPSNVNPQISQSEETYGAAMTGATAAAAGPKYNTVGTGLQTITPQQVGNLPTVAPTTTVDAGQNITGTNATDLRAQQLAQAQTAANSPSSAAAQMRAAEGQIENQQAGQAAQARGVDRAGARRAAMLATGTQEQGAASTTAALAAQEQAAKQQAYTGALAGVRAGDVSTAQAGMQAQQANQQAGLTAQQANLQAGLTAQEANQSAGIQAGNLNNQALLTAQQANQGAAINAYTAQMGATNNFLGTANQSTGAGNQANNTVAQYQANWDKTKQASIQGGTSQLMNSGGGLLSAIGMSDEKTKAEIEPIGSPSIGGGYSDQYSQMLGSAYGTSSNPEKFSDPYLTAAPTPQTNFLAPSQFGILPDNPQPSSSSQSGGGGLMGMLGGGGGGEGGGLGDMLSDIFAKEEVNRLGKGDLANWAESVPTASFRYKPGAPDTDGGAQYHVGTVAQGLERTGALGKLLTHQRPDGLKEVEYGPLGLMVGKGALERANEAKRVALEAYALATKKGVR